MLRLRGMIDYLLQFSWGVLRRTECVYSGKLLQLLRVVGFDRAE